MGDKLIFKKLKSRYALDVINTADPKISSFPLLKGYAVPRILIDYLDIIAVDHLFL